MTEKLAYGGNYDQKVSKDTKPITNVNNTEMPGQSANLSNDMKIMKVFFTTYFDGMKAEFMQQFESLEKSLICSLDQPISEAVRAAVKQEIGTVKADFDQKYSVKTKSRRFGNTEILISSKLSCWSAEVTRMRNTFFEFIGS